MSAPRPVRSYEHEVTERRVGKRGADPAPAPRGSAVHPLLRPGLWMAQPSAGLSGSGNVPWDTTGAGRPSAMREELCPPVFPRIKNIFLCMWVQSLENLLHYGVTVNVSTASLEGSLAPRPFKCMYPLTLQFHLKGWIL